MAGERYRVGLKDLIGKLPGFFLWWDFGGKEEIFKERVREGEVGKGLRCRS